MAETRIAEIGSSQSSSTATIYFPDDDYLSLFRTVSRWTIFRKMRADAQVSALLRVIELPLRSAEYFIDPPTTDRRAVTIGEFVWDALHNMDHSFSTFLEQALSCIAYGVSLFEIVYRRVGGRYYWRKFGQRMPWTIEEWHVDEHGELSHVMQRIPETQKLVKIPKSRLLVFSFRREGANYLGRPLLRDVYQHWWYKTELYKYAGIAAERMSVGVPSMRVPTDVRPGTADWDHAERIVKKFRVNEEAGVILPEGFEFEVLGGKSSFPFRQLIDHHNRMILQAGLAQFISLGETGFGTYALSSDHSDLFLMGLKALADQICDEITRSAISPLVRYNFGNDAPVPKLKANMRFDDPLKLAQSLSQLQQAGFLSPDESIEDILRKQFGFPERGDIEIRREERGNAGSSVEENATGP